MTTAGLLALGMFLMLLLVIGWTLRYGGPFRGGGGAPIKERVELSELLASVREEILEAHNKAAEQGSAIMQFEECEFEFGVELANEASGGVKVWVLDLTGGGSRTDSNVVRIKYGNIPGRAMQAPMVTVGIDKPGPEMKKQIIEEVQKQLPKEHRGDG